MTELHGALPGWVEFGVLTGLPVAFVALGFVELWLESRRLPDLSTWHWTERARELTADAATLLAISRQVWLIGAALVLLVVGGVLAPGNPVARAWWTAFLVIVAGRVAIQRRRRPYVPRRTLADRGHGMVLSLIGSTPALLLVVTMAWLGPAEWGWTAWAGYGTGVVLLLAFQLGVGFHIGCALGTLTPADERLTRLIDRVAERSGHRPRDVRIARSQMAQAYALPWRGALVFTTRLLDVLDDDQVEAVAAHEVGHLRESRRDGLLRLGVMPLLVILGTWRLIVATLGWPGFAALLVIGYLAMKRTLAHSRALETAADDHAVAHGSDASREADEADEAHEDRAHAMALERIYEANLVPVVQGSRLSTHPDLYDRMLACGVQPSYPRPAVPRVRQRTVYFAAVPVVLLVLVGLASFVLSGLADRSPVVASWAIVLRGGQPADIAALGRSLESTDPERAAQLLDFAERHAKHSSAPPAFLRSIVDDMVHDIRHGLDGH